MDFQLEGRDLALEDRLLLQTDTRPERVPCRLTAFEIWGDTEAWFTLTERDRPRRSGRVVEHRLRLAEVKARCIRDPADTDALAPGPEALGAGDEASAQDASHT